MKKTPFLLLLLLISLAVNAQVRKINVTKSTIVWTGKKITGEHKGTLQFI
jgi:hypothetical protein